MFYVVFGCGLTYTTFHFMQIMPPPFTFVPFLIGVPFVSAMAVGAFVTLQDVFIKENSLIWNP